MAVIGKVDCRVFLSYQFFRGQNKQHCRANTTKFFLVLGKIFLYKNFSNKMISVLRKEIAEITPTSVTQGKTYNNNEDCCAAAHAIDKDLSTPAATHTDGGAGWIKLEFDKIYFIHKVVIYYKFYTNWYDPNEACITRIDVFEGCVSNDNNVDVSVYQGDVKQKSCGTLQLTYGLEQSDQIYTLLCNARGDTVKLSKDTGVIAIYEIATIGTSKFSSMHVLI